MAEFSAPAKADALLDTARRLLLAEQRAIALLDDSIDESVVHAASAIAACVGRVLVSGVGKSGIVAHKIASTFCSLDMPAQFLHAGDALHGDLGAIRPEDVVIAVTHSGATRELQHIAEHGRRIGAVTVAITAYSHAPVSLLCDHILLTPQCAEGTGDSAAPMASTIASMAMGDVLALLVAQLRGNRRAQMHALHPAGDIGRKLRPLTQIMHGGDRMPLVPRDARSGDVVREITAKGLGIAGVVDIGGRLVGTISDGDLRRHADELAVLSASGLMVGHPVTVDPQADVSRALDLMRIHRISIVFVVEDGAPVGLVHIQDLLRVGIL